MGFYDYFGQEYIANIPAVIQSIKRLSNSLNHQMKVNRRNLFY